MQGSAADFEKVLGATTGLLRSRTPVRFRTGALFSPRTRKFAIL